MCDKTGLEAEQIRAIAPYSSWHPPLILSLTCSTAVGNYRKVVEVRMMLARHEWGPEQEIQVFSCDKVSTTDIS